MFTIGREREREREKSVVRIVGRYNPIYVYQKEEKKYKPTTSTIFVEIVMQ